MERATLQYLTDDQGDIYARKEGGTEVAFDPDSFGWAGVGGRNKPEEGRSLEEIEALPGFTVAVEKRRAYVPGTKPPRAVPWETWAEGAAPPAAARSLGGDGTTAYCDRLTNALGLAAQQLLLSPHRSPFIVDDLVRGRQITVAYTLLGPGPGGKGSVYIVDDGHAFKIGHTTGQPASRISSLQTGNPRVIKSVATIYGASDEVERHLHKTFRDYRLRREWFHREPLINEATKHADWAAFLRTHLPPGDWNIVLNTHWQDDTSLSEDPDEADLHDSTAHGALREQSG